MTKDETKERIKVMHEQINIMQAYVDGKQIQCKIDESIGWVSIPKPNWSKDYEYRIKPESKYRPFKDAEECLKEMSKHTPFGWLKEIKRDIWTQISYVHNEGIETVNSGSASYKSLFDCFTFFDRKPFGVKVEE